MCFNNDFGPIEFTGLVDVRCAKNVRDQASECERSALPAVRRRGREYLIHFLIVTIISFSELNMAGTEITFSEYGIRFPKRRRSIFFT